MFTYEQSGGGQGLSDGSNVCVTRLQKASLREYSTSKTRLASVTAR